MDVVQNYPTRGLLTLSVTDRTDFSSLAGSWPTWRLRTMRSFGISIEKNAPTLRETSESGGEFPKDGTLDSFWISAPRPALKAAIAGAGLSLGPNVGPTDPTNCR